MPVSNNIYYFATRNQKESVPTLVLIHGAGGTHLSWPHNIRRMTGFRVLAPDLPGHGKSAGIGEQSIEKYTDHIYRWMQGLPMTDATVIGHSMGGAIAQMLALKHPKKIRALVLLNTAASLPIDPQIMNRLATPATYRSAVDAIIVRTNPSNMDQKVRKQIADELLKIRPGVLLSDFIACNEFDIHDQIDGINIPACVITGEDDKIVSVRRSRELAEHLNSSEFHIIPQAGHMVMIERSGQVIQIMESFLENITLTD